MTSALESPVCSAVGVPTIADPQDIDPLTVIVEPDAPIADTKAELGRVNPAKTLDVSRTGCSKTVDRCDDPKSHRTIKTGQVCLRLNREDNTLAQEGSW